MKRGRVPFRVHGPFQHRSRWRLDIFENGRRYKRSFGSYGEALEAARELAAAGNSVGNPSGEAPAADRRKPSISDGASGGT